MGDEYPEFIKCMVKSFRMLRRKWNEHDAWLEEQRTVCTTPGCQCDRRCELMFRKFANGMETDDSESEEIADWSERSCGMSDANSYSEGLAPRTYTPPLKNKRGRKYASLRKHEMEVEDYLTISVKRKDGPIV